jgi:hypothetical protein
VSSLSSRQRVATAAVLILLALFLVRPGVSRLKTRIANSISRAVDRPVEIGAVHLRFLPRPGFDLDNLVIYEDPAFGAEPMLRAPQVTALVRIASLVRGRLDISRLELTEPSLNLVRRKEDGRWNLASLLERARRTPLAPTGKSKSEPRPGFPYIEAGSGRINFKFGAEKKPYALLDADFALWQESENTWGVRLKAQPLRTDMSLSDTGLLRINGIWQRAPSLLETPLQFTAEWNKAQLGQLTKLISGLDRGWRGDSRVDVSLSGSPSALQISADASIQGFHRYDILADDALNMVAHCDGKYNAAVGAVREIFCRGPVGNGQVTVKGDAGPLGSRLLNLTLNLESVPANSFAQLIRRAKKDLPADLIAEGTVSGNFSVRGDGLSAPEFEGAGELLELRLQSVSNKIEFAPGKVPFVLSPQAHSYRPDKQNSRGPNLELSPPFGEIRIDYGPIPVALGRPVPAQVHGWFARSGYGLSLHGEGEVSQTLRLASLFGLPALRANASGVAQMDLQVSGSWNQIAPSSGFSAPAVTGTVQLHKVRATAHGLHGPIEISSAELKLLPNEARINKLDALAADARWTGSITLPRGCGTPDACAIRFNLNSDEVVLSALFGWLGSHPVERRWYQVLAPSDPQPPSILRNLRASGDVNISRLLVQHVPVNHVAAALDLDRGKLNIPDLRFDVLDGNHRGEWQADFTGATPLYKGTGTVTDLSLQQAADAMHNARISEKTISENPISGKTISEAMTSGKATASYQLTANGKNSAAFWQGAEGELHFDVDNAVFPHISLANDAGPFQVSHWQGTGHLREGKIDIQSGEIVSSVRPYEVTGSVTLGQVLDLRLTDASKPTPGHPLTYRITGTLSEPLVKQTSALETQAQLKR